MESKKETERESCSENVTARKRERERERERERSERERQTVCRRKSGRECGTDINRERD